MDELPQFDEFIRYRGSLRSPGKRTSQQGLSINTIDAYRRDLETFVEFMNSRWADRWHWYRLKVGIFLAWIDSMRKQQMNDNSIYRAVRTVSNYLEFLERGRPYVRGREALADAIEQSDIRFKRPPPSEPIDDEELQHILRLGFPGKFPERDRAVLHLMYSGLRAGEIASLDCGDVNLSWRQVRVTSRGEDARPVDLDSESARALKAYLATLSSTRDDLPLFRDAIGKRLTRASISNIGRRRTGGRSAEDLRQAGAYQKYRAGVTLRKIQQSLGHANLQTVEADLQRQIAAREAKTAAPS